MRIGDIIASSEQPVFSFEFFPPKTDDGERNLRAALADPEALRAKADAARRAGVPDAAEQRAQGPAPGPRRGRSRCRHQSR